ncbi:hypothetical protein HMN09_00069100 [Mycena chlorophos]|uniref:Pali-domain-containing protein n=1 Tax=Mycena chlorophos TaxID=658473 RepID=A0A8H6TT78_MYCCL|nr:hypothetical protein HMN09_00069100 [Mycena chlorophos]
MFPAGIITSALLFIAFLLLLLDTLSVPIIKTIYLFRLTAAASSGLLDSSASESVVFGVWGYCTSGADVSVLGVNRDTAAQCSKRHLGYTFDSTVASALHVSGLENLISKTSTAALALHPVAVCLAFIALVVSLVTLRRRDARGTSRLPSFIVLGFSVFAAIMASIVFIVDIVLVAIVGHRVHNDSHGELTMKWGNATWLTLVAAILLWVAVAGTMTGVCCGQEWRLRRLRSVDQEQEKP